MNTFEIDKLNTWNNYVLEIICPFLDMFYLFLMEFFLSLWAPIIIQLLQSALGYFYLCAVSKNT